MTIRIDPEFRDLIPPLRPDERAQLEANIATEGVRDPLVVWHGTLLDGHNRYEIASRLGVPYQTVEREFESRDDAVLWIVLNQFGRRNLEVPARAKLAMRIEPILAEQAKARQVAAGEQYGRGHEKVHLNSDEPIRDIRAQNAALSNTQAAEAAGLKRDTYYKAKTVLTQAPAPIREAYEAGNLSTHQAYQKVRKELRREQDLQDLETAQATIDTEKAKSLESVCDLRVCSCADLFASGIKPDAVITDPPYPAEFLPVFTELAEGCKAAGVPLVAVMSGQSYLPEVMARLSEHLQYRWTLAYLTPGGQAVQQWQAKVNSSWKPVLLFGEAAEWFGDVSVSKPNDNDKRFHHWGQSESGMADLVQRLTKPGQLICDPFLGGGTTAVVALALGRRFVGCDIDPAHVANARARVLRV